MFARVTRLVDLPPERIQATLRHFQAEDLPAIERTPGYGGVAVGVNEQGGHAFVITFWERGRSLTRGERRRGLIRLGPSR